ncbi:MAG: adenylate/guanylate cyclase domain-containing protein [Nocardioides sp.]|nr:adenylate/guanylate cyclase domain-containing protein [Nocardioides sp.]
MPELDPSVPAHELEQAILGGERRLRARDVAEENGISLESARRLWRALGFPEPGDTEAFTSSDSEALGTLLTLVDGGVVDLDLAVNLARGVGQTMARLSDWQVSAITHRIEELARDVDTESDDDTTIANARVLAESLTGPFETLLVYVWRRHLSAAAGRIEAMRANADDLHSTELTVGFADIVSFTALSNQLDENKIGDLVELFEARCADVVATQRGRVIKSIGDSVLFVNDDPIGAFDTAEGIINVIGRDPRMPDVRVGLASGSVVMRLGDVFGPPVNMAARLTAVARRNRIIIDAATAALLPAEQFETRRLPARPVRGFGIVEPLTVRRH